MGYALTKYIPKEAEICNLGPFSEISQEIQEGESKIRNSLNVYLESKFWAAVVAEKSTATGILISEIRDKVLATKFTSLSTC